MGEKKKLWVREADWTGRQDRILLPLLLLLIKMTMTSKTFGQLLQAG